MALGKEIKVVLTLDDKGFKVGIRDANGTLKQFEQNLASTAKSVANVENHFTSLGAKAHQLVMTMGMARFALMDLRDIFLSLPLAVLKTSGEIERLTKLMEGLSKETDDAKRKLEAAANTKFLFNMAQNAPFEVKALGDAFVKLKTGGLDPTNGSLKSLVDGVAKFGGSSEQLKRAAIAIQQMSGKGVVSMEELRQQLGEAVPNAMEAMARGMRMSMSELTERVSKGTVEASNAIDKMLIVMGLQNAGAAAEMMNTWVGTIERLKTRWELFKLEIGSEGLFDGSKEAVKELIAAMGSADGGSMARSIGRGLNDALVVIVNTTKKIVEMWDTIVLAGKAWAIYWAASKATGPAQKVIEQISAMKAAVIAKRDESILAERAETAASEAAARARIPHFQEQIRQNELLIAEEHKRIAAQKAADAERVASTVAANKAEIMSHRDKAAQLALIEQEIRMRAMATALEAEKIARSKKAGSGADARRIMEDAAGLTQNADILAKERKALLDKAAALDAANAAMQRTTANQAIYNNVTNQTISGLTQKNNALKQVIAQHEAQARAITAANSAMGLMGAAASSVVGWLKGMMSSMNLLTIAIMGAVWAWDYFSSKAKKAAQDAQYALNMANLVERKKATQEAVDGAKDHIKSRKSEMQANQFEIDMALADPLYKHDKAMQARVRDLQAKNAKLKEEIDKAEAALAGGIKQVFEKNADAMASDLQAGVDEATAKAVKPFIDRTNKMVEDFKKIAKPTEAQRKAFDEAIQKEDLKALDAKRDTLLAEAARYKELTKAAGKTEVEREAYRLISERLEKQAADVGKESIRLAADNKFITPKKKDDGSSSSMLPTDDLLNKMNADARAIDKAKAAMQNMQVELIDLAQLKAQAQEEIDTIIEQDRHKKIVHTKEQEKEAVERLTNRKVIEQAVREMQAIFPRLEQSKERLRQLEEQLATGNYREVPNDEESRGLQRLEAIRRLSPGAAAAMDAVIAKQKELLEVSAKRDIATGLIDANKRIRDLEVDGILESRDRIKAAYDQEVGDVEHKYKLLIDKARKYGQDTSALEAARVREIELLNQKLARSMETPLEKLARDWADGYDQINQATKKWSEDFLDTLTEMITTGRGDWRSFLAGLATDILRMNLKKEFGAKITEVFGDLGGKVADYLGVSLAKPQGKDPTAGAAGAVGQAVTPVASDAAQKAVDAGLKSLTKTTDLASAAMVSVSNEGLAEMATSTLLSAVQTTGKMTVEQAAVAAIAQLGLAASAAAIALQQVAASSAAEGAGEIASFFFAKGGVMSSLGPLPLRKYANGGIADSPQLAIYGEGSMNEAYVPLPDGRSIPVTLTGDGRQQGGGTNVVISIVVNEAEGSVETKSAGDDDRQVWSRMAERVKGVVREELVQQSRPGGILYK